MKKKFITIHYFFIHVLLFSHTLQSMDTLQTEDEVINMHSPTSPKITLSSLNDIKTHLIPACTTLVNNASTTKNVKSAQSDKNIMNLLKSINPTLHQFGIDANLDAQELIMCSQLLQQFNLNPDAILDFMTHTNNVKNKNGNVNLAQKYQTIMNDNSSSQGQKIALDVILQLINQARGISAIPSPSTNTHINVLHDQLDEHETTITNQQNTITNRNWALTVGGILTAITTILAFVSQLYGCLNNPNNPHNGTVI